MHVFNHDLHNAVVTIRVGTVLMVSTYQLSESETLLQNHPVFDTSLCVLKIWNSVKQKSSD